MRISLIAWLGKKAFQSESPCVMRGDSRRRLVAVFVSHNRVFVCVFFCVCMREDVLFMCKRHSADCNQFSSIYLMCFSLISEASRTGNLPCLSTGHSGW